MINSGNAVCLNNAGKPFSKFSGPPKSSPFGQAALDIAANHLFPERAEGEVRLNQILVGEVKGDHGELFMGGGFGDGVRVGFRKC